MPESKRKSGLPVRIMGIDPGLENCGWGVVDDAIGQLVHVAHGVIVSASSLSETKRLSGLQLEMVNLLDLYRPDEVAYERYYLRSNRTSSILVIEAQGVIKSAIGVVDKPVYPYQSVTVKKALTGNGKAEKDEVQKMVRVFLRMNEIPSPDHAADALAVALTHASLGKWNKRVGE